MVRWLSALLMFALGSSPSHAGLDLTWSACNQGPGNLGSLNFTCDGSTIPRLFGNFQSETEMPGVAALEAVLDIGMDGGPLPTFWHFEDAGCNSGGLAISDARPAAQCPAASHATPWGPGGVEADAFVTAYLPGFNGSGRARLLLVVVRSSSNPVTIAAGPNYYAFHLDFAGDAEACGGCGTPAEIHWTSAMFQASGQTWTLNGPGIRSNWVGVNGSGPAARVFSVEPVVVFNDSARVLTMRGYGLGTGTGATLVGPGGAQIFGQSVVPTADWSALSATFDVTGAVGGAWDVVVSTPAGTDTLHGAVDLQEAFRLTSIDPDRVSKSGWVNVTIHGFGMQQGARAVLTRTPGDSLVGFSPVVSADGRTLWTRFDPTAAVAGVRTLSVRQPDGRSGTLTGGFEIVAAGPALASVVPGAGTGVTRVLLRGSGLTPGLSARLTRAGQTDLSGTEVAVAPSADSAWVTFDLNAMSAGPAFVFVTLADGVSTMLTTPFHVAPPPHVESVAPSSGHDGGSVVTSVTGSGFDPGTTFQLERGLEVIPGTLLPPVMQDLVSVRFPLLDRTTGSWDVVALRGADRSLLPLAFEIRARFRIDSIAPNHAPANTTAPVAITGRHMPSGTGVQLRRGGQPDVPGQAILVAEDGRSMVTTFDLHGVEVGAWDVIATTPGDSSWVLSSGFEVDPPTVDVPAGPVALGFALAPIRPNPSPGRLWIEYSLPRDAPVRLRVVDLQGRGVAELVSGVRGAGTHAVEWDGTTAGRPVTMGVYFVRCESGGRSAVRRVVIAR